MGRLAMNSVYFSILEFSSMITSEIFIQPFLRVGQLLAPWVVIGLIGYRLWLILKDTVTYTIQLQAIPCSRCQFFTNNHQLKCTVHPEIAMSEAAINCPDFCHISTTHRNSEPSHSK